MKLGVQFKTQKGVKMAQAKKKAATKTGKGQAKATHPRSQQRSGKQTSKNAQGSNIFFVASMSFLAATLLFANLLMINF